MSLTVEQRKHGLDGVSKSAQRTRIAKELGVYRAHWNPRMNHEQRTKLVTKIAELIEGLKANLVWVQREVLLT